MSQSDRTFDTKALAVKEDRAAGKSANSQLFQPSDKPFISHGKRQDEIDELRRQKQLSIDQVREIFARMLAATPSLALAGKLGALTGERLRELVSAPAPRARSAASTRRATTMR